MLKASSEIPKGNTVGIRRLYEKANESSLMKFQSLTSTTTTITQGICFSERVIDLHITLILTFLSQFLKIT